MYSAGQRVLDGDITGARTAVLARDGNSIFSTNVLCGGPQFFPGFPAPGTIINKDWSDQNNRTVKTDTEVTRIVVGANGEITENWSWDAYYQYGKTTRDQIGQNYTTNWRYYMATDAIIGPNGQPACRAVVTGFAPDSTVDPL